jgi:6-phosphogluconate dehydrogenase
VDRETGQPLVELILDEAEQKGTGKWSAQEALNLGVAASTMAEAVFARFISAQKKERVAAAAILPGPQPDARSSDLTIDTLRDALYMARICAYAQGFRLLQQAAAEHEWGLNLSDVALIWRGGCIIRARFLDRIKDAYQKDPSLPSLLLDAYFRQVVTKRQAGLRQVVAEATLHGLPVPGLSSACAYYDSYRREVLPANLIQAQRDFFGAHTYRRTDKKGVFHTDWAKQLH